MWTHNFYTFVYESTHLIRGVATVLTSNYEVDCDLDLVDVDWWVPVAFYRLGFLGCHGRAIIVQTVHPLKIYI